MPRLIELHDTYAEKGLVIIGLHDDSVESIDEMNQKLVKVRERAWAGRDLPFIIALDGGGDRAIEGTDATVRGATTAAYGIVGWPTAVLIGRDGTVIKKFNSRHPDARAELEKIFGDVDLGKEGSKKDESQATSEARVKRLHELLFACMAYSSDHNGEWPDDLNTPKPYVEGMNQDTPEGKERRTGQRMTLV